MDPQELGDLYDEAILKENREPYHYGKAVDADLVLEAYNPLCGDQFRIYLYLTGDHINKAYFHGYGCAVSKASASVLTRELEGLSTEEARQHCATFLSWLAENPTAPVAHVPAAWESFAAVRKFPGRLSCAQLAWQVIAQEI